jgi:hypothetical protein
VQQTAVAGSKLPVPLQVRVWRRGGCLSEIAPGGVRDVGADAPLRDVRVVWEVLSGGGDIIGAAPLCGGAAGANASCSNNQGMAHARWTLGPAVGEQRGRVHFVPTGPSLPQFQSAEFSAYALPAPPPDVIVLSVNPSRLEIEQGGQATVAVTIEREGDPGEVTLSITDVAGVLQSFSFDPHTAPGDSSILTVQIKDTAEPREHTLTVTGTAGSVTASVDVTLDITRPPDQERCVVFDAGSSWLQGWDDDYVPGRTSGTGLAYTVEERETGGNPGSFRHVTLTMGQNSGIWVQHRRENAVWRPATDGPVDRIVAEVDVRSVPPSPGEAISSFMLIQNETVYSTERVRVRDADGWVRASWNETDFVKFGTGPGGNQPDFSAQGTPIQFGYLTGSSHTTGAATATRHNGADNWRTEVCTGSS